jgi:prepilin-type N-terminal cleavage/methylation domain-containing protein
MRRRGFTLIELAIVILVIGILIGIAVPQFMRSRSHSQMKGCLSTLRKIDEGKELWAIAEHKAEGATCEMDDIVPNYLKRLPACPSGGSYQPNTLDELPTCSRGTDTTFPHRLQ